MWQSTISLFTRLIFANIFIIGCVFLWVRLYEKRSFSYLGFQKKNFAELYLKGVFGGILMFSSVVVVMAVFQLVTWENGNPMLQGIKVLFPTLVLLSGFVIQGATEEILCRGWLMPILSARYNLWVGVVLILLTFWYVARIQSKCYCLCCCKHYSSGCVLLSFCFTSR